MASASEDSKMAEAKRRALAERLKDPAFVSEWAASAPDREIVKTLLLGRPGPAAPVAQPLRAEEDGD